MSEKDQVEPLKPMEKIQVLMMEYNTLKTEIFEQSRIMHQVFGVGGTVSIAIVAFIFTNNTVLSFIVGSALIAMLVFFMYAIARMMTYVADECSKRLLELEHHINALAQDDLLAWEHRHGFQSGSDQRRVNAVVDPIKGMFGLRRSKAN